MNKTLKLIYPLILFVCAFVPAEPAIAQLCEFDAVLTLDLPFVAGDIRASADSRSAWDHIGPYNFYGHSLLLGIENADGPQLAIITLQEYEDYPADLIPDTQMLPISVPGLQSLALVERVIGKEVVGALHPSQLSFIGDPILAVLDLGGAITFRTFADTVIAAVSMIDLGLAGWAASDIAFDNDELRLFVVNETAGELAVIQFYFDGELNPELAVLPVPLPDALGGVANANYIEGSHLLMLQKEDFNNLIFLDVTDPTLPLFHSSAVLDLQIATVAASSGQCDISTGTGALFAIAEDLSGMYCMTTACDPVSPNCPSALASMPVYGTYLEPAYGISLAYDPRESHTGELEIRGRVEGPWWPARMDAFWSTDNLVYFSFAEDLSGIETPEITILDAPIDGDGWRVQYEPANEDEECTWIRVCYEVQTANGNLVYVQDSIKAQDAMKPVITEPGEDGEIVDPENPGIGETQHPDPAETDCTVVTRREVENDVADDIDSEPQRREGLPPWWFGEGEDRVCYDGGAHCAPTAAVQNIIAIADHNPCLCQLLNCYLGNGPDELCNFDDEEITELILTMGICMATNKGECGTSYGISCEAIKKFFEIISAEAAGCVQCDHNLYCHFIPSGFQGDELKWVDIVEEMDEKDQTIMLRLRRDNPDGSKSEHRVSLVSVFKQVGPCVTIVIADPWTNTSYNMEVDTRTSPPTIKGNDDWDFITGAIALSDSTDPDRSQHSLDVEYHTWDLVQSELGASTTFPLDNLTPGFWKYRVRTYFDADSADAFRLIYVPEPRELVINRVANDLQLFWRGDPYAVNYIVEYSDDQGATFDTLGVTPDTTLITDYTTTDLRLFRVSIDFAQP